MFNLQGSEIIVILLLALVVLGPEKLPDAIRKFTQTYAEFKKMSSGFQSELKSALDEPMREMRATANLMRDSVDPDKITTEAESEQRLRESAARVGDGTADADKPVSPGGPVDPFAVESLDVEPSTDDAEAITDTDRADPGGADGEPALTDGAETAEADEPPEAAAAS